MCANRGAVPKTDGVQRRRRRCLRAALRKGGWSRVAKGGPQWARSEWPEGVQERAKYEEWARRIRGLKMLTTRSREAWS